MMSKLFIVVVIIVGIGIAGAVVLSQRGPTKAPSASQTPPSTQSFELPVEMSNPTVKSVTLLYAFTGTVKQLQQIDETTYKIILNNASSTIPSLVITSSIPVYNTVDPAKKVTISDIVSDQKVTVFASYSLQNHSWHISGVGLE